MKRDFFNHGYAESDWLKAKEQARQAMIERARIGSTITYSELVAAISAITIEPHDTRLDHMLGEIAFDEDKAGRGMLTVVVVHKNGDQQPGSGFYDMARKIGRDIKKREDFWITELNYVKKIWSVKHL